MSWLWVLLLAGCGVGDEEGIGTLSGGDVRSLCKETVAATGDEDVVCDSGLVIPADTVERCEATLESFEAGCEVDVETWRGCVDARVDAPCAGYLAAECQQILACIGY